MVAAVIGINFFLPQAGHVIHPALAMIVTLLGTFCNEFHHLFDFISKDIHGSKIEKDKAVLNSIRLSERALSVVFTRPILRLIREQVL